MQEALSDPEMSIVIQKRHLYTGNVNSETPGDSRNAFLHWGDVLDALHVSDVVHQQVHIMLGSGSLLCS